MLRHPASHPQPPPVGRSRVAFGQDPERIHLDSQFVLATVGAVGGKHAPGAPHRAAVAHLAQRRLLRSIGRMAAGAAEGVIALASFLIAASRKPVTPASGRSRYDRVRMRDSRREPPVRNDLFDKSHFDRGRRWHVEVLWYTTKLMFFLSAWPWPMSLKRRLLVAFGCEVGDGLILKPRVNIHFPWRLVIGDHCWIGERVEIMNLERVTLGDHVTLSQDVFLSAAGHDSSSATMAYKNRPIQIKESTWVTSRAFIGPGVIIGEGSVIGAGAVVLSDVSAYSVMVGNPAVCVAQRRISAP